MISPPRLAGAGRGGYLETACFQGELVGCGGVVVVVGVGLGGGGDGGGGGGGTSTVVVVVCVCAW